MIQTFFERWWAQLLPWTVDHGIRIILIAIGSLIIHRVSNRFINKSIHLAVYKDGSLSEDSKKKRHKTLNRVFNIAATLFIFGAAIMMILKETGVEIGPILAGAGIVGLALGFGGQYLIRDIITGLFIIFENQYRIGDWVNFDGNVGGLVEDITLRVTTLRDLNGTVHYVPHGEIKRVSNFSQKFARINLNVGVAYSADLEHVIKIINRVGQEMAEDPKWKDIILKPPAFLRVDNLAESSVELKILGEVQPLKQWSASGELRKRIKIAFDKEGIEIPFPQVVMHRID